MSWMQSPPPVLRSSAHRAPAPGRVAHSCIASAWRAPGRVARSSLASAQPTPGRVARFFAPAVLLALLASGLAAQMVPFGKNKIQYRDFDWKVLAGPHLDVYFYPEEEPVARLALADGEAQFAALERRFHHHPSRRIPLIVYASDQHFEQTNVMPGFIPEGVLGFTEYLKRRVALPFRGDYEQFRHTLRHELVHAFQLSKLEEVEDAHPRVNRPSPQGVLWWTEGLAEYWSSQQSTEDDMFVRDLVLSGKLPTIQQFNQMYGYAAYPLGAALHQWLTSRFGEELITRVYESFWRYDGFGQTLAAVTGETLDRLSREWKFDLERRYFPLFADRKPLDIGAQRLLWKGGANFQPEVWVPQGDTTGWLLFLSPRDGYTSLYATTLAAGEKKAHPVLKGERSAQFESFHAYESRFAVNRAGVAAIVSRFLDRDALLLWDVRRRRLVGRYQWPDLVGLKSPAWAPAGDRIVFEGLTTAGFSDLYVLDLRAGGQAERVALTGDHYRDADPDWSPDASTIVFASDRTAAGGATGNTNLFLYDVATRRIRPLTYGPWQDRNPRWSHDGRRVLFASDRSGIFDLYAIDGSGTGRRLTALSGGAFTPQWLPDDHGFVFSGFADGEFAIYRQELGADSAKGPAIALELPRDTAADTLRVAQAAMPTDGWRWEATAGSSAERATPHPYREWRGFSLDFASGDAAIAPAFGSSQGVQFLASDLLGDHMVFLGITAAQASSGVSSLLENFSGQVLYLNVRHRLNYGFGIHRYRGFFRDVSLAVYRESSVGGSFVASWPFSKFRRLEFEAEVEKGDRADYTDLFGFVDRRPGDTRNLTRRGFLASQYASYVKDNTLWLPTGPIDGTRYNITAGLVSCFVCTTPSPVSGNDVSRNAVAENFVLAGDWRTYLRTSLYSAYAVRAYGYWSDGAIPGRAILGGTWMLRGYPRWSLAGSRLLLLNQEWRFPLLHEIALVTPLGVVALPGIEAAPFADIGSSWVERTKPSGAWGSYGLSFRMSLGAPLVLRLDTGRRFRIGDEPPVAWTGGNSFGKRFLDFFFGYDF